MGFDETEKVGFKGGIYLNPILKWVPPTTCHIPVLLLISTPKIYVLVNDVNV